MSLGSKPDRAAACRAKFSKALAKVDAKAAKAGTSCRYLFNGDGTGVRTWDTNGEEQDPDCNCRARFSGASRAGAQTARSSRSLQ
jgi:hypothetical protein